MPFNRKPMPLGDLVLKLFYVGLFKFNNFATTETNQMIMVFVKMAGFIPSLAIAKVALLSDTTFSKQFERTMDCSVANPRVFIA
jgi:hypothetical protein